LDDYRQDFEAAMNDDFNTPKALATLFDFANEVNRYLDQEPQVSTGTLAAMDKIAQELGGDVLGILPQDLVDERVGGDMVEGLVELLLDLREEYREERAWDKADEIRARLSDMGIALEDGPEGTGWRVMSYTS
jgi:cysteinyl-tRNA synthetase